MRLIAILIGLFISVSFFGQELKILEPFAIVELDFSPEYIAKFNSEEAFNECSKVLAKVKSEGRNYNTLTEQEKEVLKYCDEVRESAWDIIGGGCSWYCDGGPKNVTASSFLEPQGKITYGSQNAHDLNYETAWVNGVKGYGIGEYLLYTFSAESPRITEIIVVNGYVKSQSAWENNSRVKSLKVFINDEPYAVLNLKDIRGSQSFKVSPIGNANREDLSALKNKPDWNIKFEISDVYKGLKYDDVVITEIYFNGLDVHCFAKGTKILMADKSTQNIETLKIGDSVAYIDYNSKELKSAKIRKLENVVHQNLVSYRFESGLEVTVTQDHPFKIQDKGWASLNPEKSKNYKGFNNIEKIYIGDFFLTWIGTDKLVEIVNLIGKQETFTISELDSGDNFIANGFIVGVEELID